MIQSIRRRIDPAGVKELTIRRRGEDQIEIIMPKVEADEIEVVKRQISSIGALEFRITANQLDPNHQAWIRLAQDQPRHADDSRSRRQGTRPVGRRSAPTWGQRD